MAAVLKITEATDTNIRTSMESILRIADRLERKNKGEKDDKIKLPQHLPLIVKARLHTGGREYEKIKQELKGRASPAIR